MKKKQPDWRNYWKDTDDLNLLLKARTNITETYSEIRNNIGRMLMSEEMLEIQESLEQRIEELKKEKKNKQKIAA